MKVLITGGMGVIGAETTRKSRSRRATGRWCSRATATTV